MSVRLVRDGSEWRAVVEADSAAMAAEVLGRPEGYLVDDPCGRAIGVVDEVVDGPNGAELIVASGGWGRIRRCRVPAAAVTEIHPAAGRLVVPRVSAAERDNPTEGGGMNRCVICGVDDGDGVVEVVRVASELAEALRARLLLVHAAEMPVIPGAAGVPGGQQQLAELALADGEQLLDDVVGATGLASSELRARAGAPTEVLRRVCRDEGASLLVVGSRGRGNLRSALMGSVSAELCRSAPCPVVVVPQLARRTASPLRREAEAVQ